MNSYDIESMQVLKDTGAYKIYGVRGANGGNRDNNQKIICRNTRYLEEK